MSAASSNKTPAVLTIAGSDSGGGAGIQADLKAFHALGVFGTTVITCITAQNPDGVTGVAATDPEMVSLQLRTVCDGFPIAAAKTGMLFSADIIRCVAKTLAEITIPYLVVDPVMIATSGASLLKSDAVDALRDTLLPMATVVTPNIPEAEVLCGHNIPTPNALREAAAEISKTYGVACALKGGHLDSDTVLDVLFAQGQLHEWESPRLDVPENHGTGCTFAAALTASLAKGMTLPEATAAAKHFVTAGLQNAIQVGSHFPLGV